MEAAFCSDNEGLTPLGYGEECNIDGLVSMIAALCNRRKSMAQMVENESTVWNIQRRGRFKIKGRVRENP